LFGSQLIVDDLPYTLIRRQWLIYSLRATQGGKQ
jgi:hypothetical protein